MTVKCPKCGYDSADSKTCNRCGVDFAGYQRFLAKHAPATQPPVSLDQGFEFLDGLEEVFIQQHEDALRIVTGFQTLNNYSIQSATGEVFARLGERDNGGFSFLARQFFRSRRPLTIDIVSSQGAQIAELNRPFFWFFSDLFIRAIGFNAGHGRVENKLSFWMPKYNLYDLDGRIFAQLRCPVLGASSIGGALIGDRNYQAYNLTGEETGAAILRKWNGAMRIFTDEDTYCVKFSQAMTKSQKLVLLCAAISIDFDSYEHDKNLIQPVGAVVGSVMGSTFSDDNN